MGKSLKDAKSKLHLLESQYMWLTHEKATFNSPDTLYDFTNKTSSDFQEAKKELEIKKQNLNKKLNPNAEQMFEQAEKDYEELQRKKDIVKHQKDKLRDSI